MSFLKSQRQICCRNLVATITRQCNMMSSGNVSQKEIDKRLKQPGYLHLLARDMFSSPPEQVILTFVVGHHNHRHHCHCHYYHCHFHHCHQHHCHRHHCHRHHCHCHHCHQHFSRHVMSDIVRCGGQLKASSLTGRWN